MSILHNNVILRYTASKVLSICTHKAQFNCCKWTSLIIRVTRVHWQSDILYTIKFIYLMSLIFFKHFHIACRQSGASGAFTNDLALPKSVAACRPPTSHEFTYVAGFHWFNGGPTIETNSNEDKQMWQTVRVERRGVHIRFILLNPRSHSAVLIGSEWTAMRSRLRLDGGVGA